MCYYMSMRTRNRSNATRCAPCALPPPLESFTSAGGRTFVVLAGAHEERWDGDALWTDVWSITLDGAPAGKLYRSLSYGTTASGEPRWHATTRELFWNRASDAPTGVGFDVAAFDSAEEALAAWGRSADQICDWAEGKPVNGHVRVVRAPVCPRCLDIEPGAHRPRPRPPYTGPLTPGLCDPCEQLTSAWLAAERGGSR
jgi:hypothetical protein